MRRETRDAEKRREGERERRREGEIQSEQNMKQGPLIGGRDPGVHFVDTRGSRISGEVCILREGL